MLKEYFIEIKHRLILLLVSWTITFFTCYFYKEAFFYFLIKSNTNIYTTNHFYFIFTKPMDMFTLYIDLSYFVTNQVFVLFLVYHCIIFFAPGLFKYEYHFIKSIFFISSFCFVVSFVVFIYIVLPKFWDFFLSFQGQQSFQKVNVFFEAQINEYFNFYSKFYYFVISIGQVFSFITVYLNLMQFDCFQVSKIRKTCYCVFFFFATIMTPPEVISQLITGMGFILIYEGILFLIILKGSKKFLNNYNYFKLYVNKI